MKFLILSYNPTYIKIKHVTDLVQEIFVNHSCPVHVIEHDDNESAPIFCVEAVDTDSKEDD